MQLDDRQPGGAGDGLEAAGHDVRPPRRAIALAEDQAVVLPRLAGELAL
jgi:hypothetical protein